MAKLPNITKFRRTRLNLALQLSTISWHPQGGCLTGTFAGMLKARKVPLGSDGISADVRGEIERESDNVLVIKRIHVIYHLSTSPDEKERVFQLHEMHAGKCPAYRSLTPGIVITTELDWNETK